MNPLAWLLGLVLPACGVAGAGGVPVPPPLDLAQLQRPATPNTALAAPAGGTPAPDIATPLYAEPASLLWAQVSAVAAAQPRTFPLASDAGTLQAAWVVRSAVFNFPDIVSVRVEPRGAAASTLAIYSRSLYGHSDLGVNRRRVQDWLAALDRAAAAPPPESPPRKER